MNKITHLYAIGDSFAFGEGLKGFKKYPSGASPFNNELRKTVFSGIMADTLNIGNYNNAAMPGSSNNRTQRVLMADMIGMMLSGTNPENILAIINITHSARIEVYDGKSNSYRQLITNFAPSQSEKELYEYWKNYSAYFDNVVENVDRYLTQILSMQAFLEKYKIKYLMVNSMGEYEEFTKFIKKSRTSLYTSINRRTYPEIKSFNDWAHDQGFPCTPCFHANEDAHAAWATHLLKYIEQEKILEL